MLDLVGIFGGLFVMIVSVVVILLVLAAIAMPLYVIAINDKLGRVVVILEEMTGEGVDEQKV